MAKPKEASWTCHAKLAALNGQTCMHLNHKGVVLRDILCCEKCGCTKKASDDRRKEVAEKKNVRKLWGQLLKTASRKGKR